MANILLAGGGTAGHVNPLLATADELAARGHHCVVLGTQEGLEADLVPRAGYPLKVIPRVPLPRRPSADLLRVPSRLNNAIKQTRHVITNEKIDVVVGFGGYVSTPAYRAAKQAGVPIVVHEANARPGLANRLGARWAAAVATTFPGTPLPGAVVTGLPLRAELRDLAGTLRGPAGPERIVQARAHYGWDGAGLVVLVTGGSLGALTLNNAVSAAIGDLTANGVRVIHLTGRGKQHAAEQARELLPLDVQQNYVVQEYAHSMTDAFAAADVVVCRSGAGTVAEVSTLGLPAVYVPLAHGNGEQARNAVHAVEAGAAVIVDDGSFTGERLLEEIRPLLADSDRLSEWQERARSLSDLDGAVALANLIEAQA